MEQPADANRDPVHTLVGAGAVFLGHAALVLLAMVAGTVSTGSSDTFAMAIFAIGVAQLIYVLPMMAISWNSGRKPFFWGVLGGAAVTLLLNGGCWGFVMTNLSGI